MATASLFVSEIRLKDFRGISHLWLPLRELTVLIGENNTGKTTLVEALGIALGDRPALEDLQITSTGERKGTFAIDIRIRPGHGDEFDDTTQSILNDAIQLGEKQQYVAIRTIGKEDDRQLDVVIQRRFLRGWETEPKAADKLPVLSRPGVSREVLELFRFNLLDAKRDIVEQLRSRTTFWGQMARDLSISDDLRGDIEQSLTTLGRKIVSNSETLRLVKTELDSLVKSVANAGTVSVVPIPAKLDELVRGMDVVVQSQDSPAVPIGRYGMGTRSLAALLVFRAFVDRTLQRGLDPIPHPVSAFEEPEAHLHPQGQRAVYTLLKDVSGQKIVSTHSPYVASIGDVYDFRVFHRRKGQVSVSWIPEVDPKGRPSLSTDEIIMMRRFIQNKHGEVLFAKAVILYEGETEDAALSELARSQWGDGGADERGISLVSVEGAPNFKHYCFLLQHLGIEWFCLVDGDEAGRRGVDSICAYLKQSRQNLSPRLVVLPERGKGMDFEEYLVHRGFRPQIERAIERYGGPGALNVFKTRLQNQKGKNGLPRDYSSNGWEERLVVDYMHNEKGKLGRFIAEEVVKVRMPPRIRELFRRVEGALT